MLTPIAKRILIQPIEAPKENKVLLIGNKPKQFTVIQIGDEVTKVKPGNIIYLEKHYGIEIEHDSIKYLVIDENSILAKVTVD